jgi:hypothetical protein
MHQLYGYFNLGCNTYTHGNVTRKFPVRLSQINSFLLQNWSTGDQTRSCKGREEVGTNGRRKMWGKGAGG